MMDGSPKLSGETLIVHHIPLVHCQVSGRQPSWGSCSAGSLKRSNPFSQPENLGLSRTTSLPERDVLQREALLYSSLIHTSSGSCSSHTGQGCSGDMVSDDSSFTSGNSEDQLTTAHTLPRAKPRSRNPLRHNPFLLTTKDEEDEEEDADELPSCIEDSSYHLHGNTCPALDDGLASFHLQDLDFASEPFLLHGSVQGGSHESLRGGASDLSTHLEELDILGLDRQRRHGSSGSNMSVDWGDEEDDEDQLMRYGRGSKTGSYSSSSSMQHCSCCMLSQNFTHHFPATFSDPCHHGYASDSSCNSSDGVLVNFSTIYNKVNNDVPEKLPVPTRANLNSSMDQNYSCSSLTSDPAGKQSGSGGGAFYLDLHSSPTEPPPSTQQASYPGRAFPLIHEPHLSTSSTCSCSVEHQGALDLDANCNSYLPPCSGSSDDLVSCLQSQARLVVATQNYYKLVTCDLSSLSSPSPAPSSVNSCSDEHSKGSPTPTQPSEYFLFRQEADQNNVNVEDEHRPSPQQEQQNENGENEEEEEELTNEAAGGAGVPSPMIQGQVYVGTSPTVFGQSIIGGEASSGSRPRSRSYDRNLDKSPSPRPGSLERMLSCPVRLGEGAPPAPPPPLRITSFAEIARSKRRNGGVGVSPSLKAATDLFSSTYSAHSHSPILEQRVEADSRSLSPVTFTRCYSQGSMEHLLEATMESQAKDEVTVGVSEASDCPPAVVVRYSHDQRPTSLPIQPFTFHHQFTCKPAQSKPVLLSGFVSGMQAHCGSASSPGSLSHSASGGPMGEDSVDAAENVRTTVDPPPAFVRPSPLGSYSPVRLQGPPSSGACSTCSPCLQPPPHVLTRPLSVGFAPPHTPLKTKHGAGSAPLPQTPPPSLTVKRGAVPQPLTTLQGPQYRSLAPPTLVALHSDTLSPLNSVESGIKGEGATKQGGGARTQNAHHLSPQALKWREYRRRNPLGVEWVNGSNFLSAHAELQQAAGPRPARRNVFDFPAAPPSSRMGRLRDDGSSVKTHQSDFLLDYFSLSEKPPEEFCLSPDASSSSPSSSSLLQSHVSVDLILKYLCPALQDVLQDGLKAFVLDLIIGQRRCQPWSLVEASTQLGPSTRVLHTLFSKGPFRPLFQEFLLLLQPLSLLPFDLDLLFEPHLLQKGAEHMHHKEQLCSAGQRVDQSARSTFQLMRGWSTTVSGVVRDTSGEAKTERAELRREGTWPRRREETAGVGQEERRAKKEGEESEKGRRQAGWWYQLMQSSRVYIDQSNEKSVFIKNDKKKKCTERQRGQVPPTREGVVEGAESRPELASFRSGRKESCGQQRRPSWMGSPPESVLSPTAPSAGLEQNCSPNHSLRWSRLFGSSRWEGSALRGRGQKTRPPSGWLTLDRSVLDLVIYTIGAGSGKKVETPDVAHTITSPQPPEAKQPSPCEVRALCHHIATERGQLSFNKGDVLRVISRADPDWLLCSLGSTHGLVPIVYMTLNSTEDGMEESKDAAVKLSSDEDDV